MRGFSFPFFLFSEMGKKYTLDFIVLALGGACNNINNCKVDLCTFFPHEMCSFSSLKNVLELLSFIY